MVPMVYHIEGNTAIESVASHCRACLVIMCAAVWVQTCELQSADVLIVGSGAVCCAKESGEHTTETLWRIMKPSENDGIIKKYREQCTLKNQMASIYTGCSPRQVRRTSDIKVLQLLIAQGEDSDLQSDSTGQDRGRRHGGSGDAGSCVVVTQALHLCRLSQFSGVCSR